MCSGKSQVLGITREEAAEFLRMGDTGFIRQVELPPGNSAKDFSKVQTNLRQLELIHSAAPFYAGLLTEDNRELQILLFCAALESSNLPARQEAALSLITMILGSGGEYEILGILNLLDSGNLKKMEDLNALRAACLYSLGRYEEAAKLPPANYDEVYSLADSYSAKLAGWHRAFVLFSGWKASQAKDNESLRGEFQAFLLGPISEEIRNWASEKVFLEVDLLDPVEQRALLAKLSQSNYRAALSNLRPALDEDGLIFFQYPDLLTDLGRAYQYTPGMRDEGALLFTSWVRLLETLSGKDGSEELFSYLKSLDDEALKIRKFFVSFYAGRIERARERYTESSEHFRRAQVFAPNELQSDACLWYVMMNALTESHTAAVLEALSTMRLWNDVSYFADVLDRLSCYFVARRQWNTLEELFLALETKGSSLSLAQYAWILGRAAQEGYIETNRNSENFFRIAYEGGKGSFYYRAMAASVLGETLVPGSSETALSSPTSGAPEDSGNAPQLEFLLGFFECGAASFVMPYLSAREEKLSVPELRQVAQALAASGVWNQSLNLVSRYTGRKDYEVALPDLYLFYPQPFRELIEKYALEAKLGAEILFALVRTESYFISDVVSRSGAVGLSQLMPPTAEEMAGRIARRGGTDYRGSGLDLKNPEINLHIGSFYLRYLIDNMGGPMPALMAYNGGMGRMRRWLAADRQRGALPLDLFLETIEFTETREYGRRVLAAAAVYGYLYYGMSMAEVAANIYSTVER